MLPENIQLYVFKKLNITPSSGWKLNKSWSFLWLINVYAILKLLTNFMHLYSLLSDYKRIIVFMFLKFYTSFLWIFFVVNRDLETSWKSCCFKQFVKLLLTKAYLTFSPICSFKHVKVAVFRSSLSFTLSIHHTRKKVVILIEFTLKLWLGKLARLFSF